MKHWPCKAPRCGHEWDGGRETCDWCGSPGEPLEDLTAYLRNNAYDRARVEYLTWKIGTHTRRKGET